MEQRTLQGGDPIGEWSWYREGLLDRSIGEKLKRISSAKGITYHNLQRNFDKALEEIADIYRYDEQPVKADAVLGILEAIEDTYLYTSELIIFRKFADLPQVENEHVNLWGRIRIIHKNEDKLVRESVRKDMRTSLWSAIDKSIDKCKKKHEIRQFSHNDVKDLQTGLKNGLEELENKTQNEWFVRKLIKLGLIDQKSAEKVIKISKDWFNTLNWNDRVVSIHSIFEAVLVGGIENFEGYKKYLEGKK